jgi:hypothetical protein
VSDGAAVVDLGGDGAGAGECKMKKNGDMLCTTNVEERIAGK